MIFHPFRLFAFIPYPSNLLPRIDNPFKQPNTSSCTLLNHIKIIYIHAKLGTIYFFLYLFPIHQFLTNILLSNDRFFFMTMYYSMIWHNLFNQAPNNVFFRRRKLIYLLHFPFFGNKYNTPNMFTSFPIFLSLGNNNARNRLAYISLISGL